MFRDNDYLHVWLMKIENAATTEELLGGIKKNAFLYAMLLNRSGSHGRAKQFYNSITLTKYDDPIDEVDFLLAGASLAESASAQVEFYSKAISKIQNMLNNHPSDVLQQKHNITLINIAFAYFLQNDYVSCRNYLLQVETGLLTVRYVIM